MNENLNDHTHQGLTHDEITEGGKILIEVVAASTGNSPIALITLLTEMAQFAALNQWADFAIEVRKGLMKTREVVTLENQFDPENVHQDRLENFYKVYDAQMPRLDEILAKAVVQ